jgi:hypothetical protein
MFFDTFGKLKYSPKRLGTHVSANWWAILDCDAAIGKYYRKLYQYHTYGVAKLARSSWCEHVTIVRNEEPPDKTKWERYAGKEFFIRIFCEAETDGEYVWFPVYCEAAHVIRRELGLPAAGTIPFHLTIGHFQ